MPVSYSIFCSAGWGCRINQLHLSWGIRHPPTNECPGYDTKQSDGEVTVILKLWGMQTTPLLSSLPGPLWSGVVAPDRVLSIGQIEVNCVLMLSWTAWNRTVLDIEPVYLELLCKQKTILILNRIVWNRTVYMYKNGFDINNLQWSMCYQTKRES